MNAPKILVSACLLGCPVRYDGTSKPIAHSVLHRWHANGWLVPFCPEHAGGLPTPRPAAELQADGRVLTREGADVTAAFLSGAEQALSICQQQKIKYALLKESSPSCGSSNVYDGRFRDRKIPGEGITGRLLREHGILVFPEQRVHELFTLLS